MRRISEELLLEGISLSSPGLSSGRAGVALSLGLYSLAEADEYLQERSVEFVEECLLYQGEDYSLSQGWCGIALCLLRLIQAGLLEADYHELLGAQHQELERLCRQILGGNGVISLAYDGALYLHHYAELFPSEQIYTLGEGLLQQMAEVLTGAILNRCGSIELRAQAGRGTELVRAMIRYLYACQVYGSDPSGELLQAYGRAYSMGALPSSLCLGLLLARSATSLEPLAQLNLEKGMEGIQYVSSPELGTILEVLNLLDPSSPKNLVLLHTCHQMIGIGTRVQESLLLRALPPRGSRHSYSSGLSGLLLHLLDLEHPGYSQHIII